MAISQIIKYEGDNSTFIWKHPVEDFNTTSQLIVHESQEALFYMNGKICDVFGAGRHTLETQNIPIIKSITNIPTGSVSPFHCEVYFVNKTEHMAIKWGTDSKVQYVEPTFKFPIYIGANGEMTLKVSDSKKLLINIVGTETKLDRESLVSYFRAFLMTRVKTYIAQVMKESKINIFEIDEKLEDFSNALKAKLVGDFNEYGVELSKFFVTTIVKPDGDSQYEKFKDLHFRMYADVAEAELQKKVGIIEQEKKKEQMIIEAEGIAEKRKKEGYTYQQERGFDVAEGVAKNEGSAGNFAGMGIGLGMMAGVGGSVGGVVTGAIKDAFTGKDTTKKYCSKCGSELSEGMEYCSTCGAKIELKQDKCNKCGYVFNSDEVFCPKCGVKRGESNEK